MTRAISWGFGLLAKSAFGNGFAVRLGVVESAKSSRQELKREHIFSD